VAPRRLGWPSIPAGKKVVWPVQISTLRHVLLAGGNPGAIMSQKLRLTIAIAAVVFASLPTSGQAQVAATQIMLSQKQIEGFIAVQRDMLEVAEKIQGAGFSDRANEQYKAQLRAISKKRGFKNFAEYQLVAANISVVMAAIDPQTKEFTDPQSVIKKELEDVQADKTLPDDEKKKMLGELNAALKVAQSIQFPTNIELVKKYYDKIDMTTITDSGGDSRPTSSAVRTISE
jgi:hypothetical protein